MQYSIVSHRQSSSSFRNVVTFFQEYGCHAFSFLPVQMKMELIRTVCLFILCVTSHRPMFPKHHHHREGESLPKTKDRKQFGFLRSFRTTLVDDGETEMRFSIANQQHRIHSWPSRKRRPTVIFSAAATAALAVSSSSSSSLSTTLPIFFVPGTPTATTAAAAMISSSSSSKTTTGKSWSEDASNRRMSLERCIPPLTSTSHKGSNGRVGVLGGSAKYTGAPYYAAMASLKVGADLVTIFTASEATTPIKCYSPELMVAPVYTAKDFDDIVRKQKQNTEEDDDLFMLFDGSKDDDTKNNDKQHVEELISSMVDEVIAMMDKLHVLVIGPGLGRCPIVLEATSRIIETARRPPYNLPLVLDADALYLLTIPRYQNVLLLPPSSSSTTTTTPPPVVLTPNVMERKRLDQSNVMLPTDGSCIVIEKGKVDEIKQPVPPPLGAATDTDDHSCANNGTYDSHDRSFEFELKMACGEEGGLKRSGGIGDILAGTCGTLLGWNRILSTNNKNVSSGLDDVPLACWTACCFVKQSTKRAFDMHRRSMTAPDILDTLGQTIDDMTSPT